MFNIVYNLAAVQGYNSIEGESLLCHQQLVLSKTARCHSLENIFIPKIGCYATS